jgi:type I restriction enzyme S subunit
MSDCWKETTWGAESDLVYGRSLSDYRDGAGSVEVFGTNGPIGWTDKSPMATGPVAVVGRKGAYRGVHLAKGPCWVIDTAYHLKCGPNLDPTWSYYALQNVDINGMDSGSAIPSLTRDHFRAVPLSLPPFAEQRRIAGALGTMDDLIEVNRRLMGQCAELITLSYRHMMATSKGELQPVFDVLDIDFGSAYKGSSFTPPGVGMPLLRIRDLKAFESDTWTTERIPGDVVVQPGEVVVGMDAEFRATFWLGAPSLLNQRVLRVRPRIGSIAFAREVLVDPLALIEGYKTGTTVIHLNKADLAQTRLVIPDQRALSVFDSVAEPLREMLVMLHQENVELAASRDELLSPLMSGRVRVGEGSAV